MKKMILLFSMMLIINNRGFAVERIFEAVPKEISGWQAEGQDEFYNRETVYGYIDGGAELYLTYDFQTVFARRYLKPNAPEIVLEIYDMNSSKDAYGIFSSERQDEEVGIGQDSEYGGGLLRFWKDKYFISILSIGDEEIAKPAVFELGEKVAEVIPASGDRPDIVKYLPQENLIKNKIRFFHTHTILNRQYYLSNENILNLDRKTDCVFAPYQIGPKKSYLLLIRYLNQSQANKAHKSLLANYLPEAQSTGFVKLENGRWTMVKTANQFLMIVFEAPEKQCASDLLLKVTELMKLK